MGLWKDIDKEAFQLKQNCEFTVGDDKNIGFWEDAHCSRMPLCEGFPLLYNIADSEGAKVADLWVLQDDLGAWHPKFVRAFNDWELDIVQDFFDVLNNRSINPQLKDKPILRGITQGVSL